MGLLILIVVGALLGWLATIVLRVETGRSILANALVGIAGSLVLGIVAGNGAILAALTAYALLWSLIGAVAAIALFNLLRRQRTYS